ncbi:hypothetical protein G7B40_009155 [Aetokthonos hydrillicola Thurmond2011]|jgi:photosystem II stability/assembly factor-like uncharacterized protein|uniref:Uncharacterized protein n=1 Tax=Aetokthonos hydrillicola Thurmond2011 TaxID=2712845 RepID=A0AAP5I949_9CYAN|nr:hypothetical protein [Aetokthonos hydrillicola]MBO3457583.1 hypothetical protein [Aetokthonos hydrillicola CCALA 1050]MBW4590916.1 hypothetical protein [Aetokthonos hydrillicola CCALA 1050]MDR9894735.1 hypothetical protein [Aetokthonos hydrillicola Thurmond2011]
MNQGDNENLYKLLPAIYRIRDELQGYPLQALLGVIEQEILLIESDIENLYENWFIETCDRWVVPYIGDLLDVKFYTDSLRTSGQERRAYVANTIAYRSRKGTVPVLEQLVVDITDWRARVVEFFKFIGTTQNINNPRLGSVTVDVRNSQVVNTPFATNNAYTIDIRNSGKNRGNYNISNIGIYLWRLKSYPLEKVTAHLDKTVVDNTLKGQCYTFSPLGNSIPLFNQPQTETEITSLAQEVNVPGKLRRTALAQEIDQIRQLLAKENKSPDIEGYFVRDQPVFEIFENSNLIAPPEIYIDDLTNWKLPPDTHYKKFDGSTYQVKVAVDPELGRIVFRQQPNIVNVNYSYAFSGDIGGGSYDRSLSINSSISPTQSRIAWNIDANSSSDDKNPLLTAVQSWNKNVQIWEYCQELFYIPLGRLAINSDRAIMQVTPQLQPGIFTGLTVISAPLTSEVIVNPGKAVDSQGQLIDLKIKYRVNLKTYANQTVLLLISYKKAPTEPKWEIQVIPNSTNVPSLSIPLARLIIDSQGKIEKLSREVRSQFQPGIVSGLVVDYQHDLHLIAVSAGKAINSQAKLIQLENGASTTLDILNTNNCPNWLVYLTLKGKVSLVRDEEIGVITLKTNQTYRGNLTLRIPADKHLQIIAASEYRPHLAGNLLIEGIAKNNVNPGKLTLNGLLLAGKVTVLPGNLRRLTISNCTVVPQNGGIIVKRKQEQISETPTEDDDGFSLIVLVIYCFNLIQKVLQIGVGVDSQKSQNVLMQLFQLAKQQVARFLMTLQDILSQWECPELPDDSNDKQGDCWTSVDIALEKNNSNLAIAIDNSICGAINIADTVPHLEIVDSIIDRGYKQTAITAFDTHAEITTTTIFGATTLRSLEASNSLFLEKLTVLRQQDGCMRFCYFPNDSRTPSRYRCQPDLALATIPNLPAGITALAISTTDIFAGTAGNGVFRAQNDKWIPVNQGLNDANLTPIYSDAKTGTGTISSKGTSITGIGTRFLVELQKGDRLVIANETKTVISLNDAQALTIDTAFKQDLLPTSFRIKNLLLDINITALVIHNNTLFAGTTGGRIFHSSNNGDSWTSNIPGLENQGVNTDITVLMSHQNHSLLFAGTSGNGLFRSQDNGNNWEQINPDLKNQNITACVVNINTQEIFVGTFGGGVFRSINNGDSWLAMNRNLTHLYVTTLTINQNNGQIFVGTTGGGIFRFESDYEQWQQINVGLTNIDITALVVYSKKGQGTIKSEGNKLIGDGTIFQQQLAKGSCITVNNENKTVTSIDRNSPNNLLTIDIAFSNDLSPDTSFNINYLLAGTTDGNIFASIDNGRSWDLKNAISLSGGITTLAIQQNNQESIVFAGTAVGSILRYDEDNNNWLSVNQGLNNVEEKMLFLRRLQPSFSSQDYGDPNYAQLSQLCSPEIRTGAENGAEMGAFNYLKNAQREVSLQASLKEYLRFGLELGIFYET